MTSEMRVADEALEAACDELVSSVLQLGQSEDRDTTEKELSTCRAEILHRLLSVVPKRLASARQVQNHHFSAFSRLPAELWTIIFQLSLPQTSDNAYFAHLYQLISVCRDFRLHINSFPAFWSYITESWPNSRIDFVLERCKNAPLDVYCFLSLLGRLLVLEKPIRSLSLSLVSGKTTLELLQKPFPHLQTLHISSALPTSSSKKELFCGVANKLTDVSLFRVALPWRFVGLTRLHLRDIVRSAPTVASFLHMLAASPALSYLYVVGVHFGSSEVGQRAIRAKLHQLLYLEFQIENALLADTILRNIQAPHCQRTSLNITYGLANAEAADAQFLSTFAQGFKRTVGGCTSATLEVGRSDFLLITNSPDQLDFVSLDIQGAKSSLWLTWFTEHCAPDPESTFAKDGQLSLSLSSRSIMDQRDLLDGLNRFPVKEISARGRAITALLRHLGKPSASSWLFHKLHLLDIGPLSDSIALLEMLRPRYGAIEEDDETSPTEGSVLPKPAALQRLRIWRRKLTRIDFVNDIDMMVQRHGGVCAWREGSEED